MHSFSNERFLAHFVPMPKPSSAAIPRTVWALGFVSLLMDVSSEMIHALLPLFMAQTLGAGALWIGLVEGLGEGAALLTKVVSGVVADRFGHKKLLVFLGYGLGVLSKPLFALAGAMPVVLGARVADRIGKGLRGAPRDALVADVTPEAVRGAAFGLRQSLDAAGAFVGPLLASALLLFWTDDYRSIFWVALIPGVLCLLLILFCVEEGNAPANGNREKTAKRSLPKFHVLSDSAFRSLVVLGSLFAVARFSNAFIVLRASDAGFGAAAIPLLIMGMNLVFSAASYPFGKWADKTDPKTLLAIGIGILIFADLAFALLPTQWGVLIGVVLTGLHLGATQGIFSMLVAATAPENERASAFGIFGFASGLSAVAAGLLAGLLWDAFGPEATFLGGALLALFALAWLRLQR